MSQYQEEYEKFVSSFEMVGSTSIIANPQNIEHYACVGKESIEKNTSTKLDTIYRIASISKMVVAICVMQLHEKKLINIENDISNYLGFSFRNPNYPNIPITTKMILTQTSSISDQGEEHRGYDGVNQIDDEVSLEDLLINQTSPYYTSKTFQQVMPGSTFEYSNLGCGILACLVERVTGQFFPDYVLENVLNPLSIESGFRLENLKHKDHLAGHYLYDESYPSHFKLYRDYDLFKKVQCPKYTIGNNFRGVAGGLYISGYDLTKIMQMFMNKGKYHGIKILESETVDYMEEVHWHGNPKDPTYKAKGLQMIIMDQFTKEPLKGHFGNAYGLRSFLLYTRNKGLIFLCNGANFLSDEEHMTILQEKVIRFMCEYAKIEGSTK